MVKLASMKGYTAIGRVSEALQPNVVELAVRVTGKVLVVVFKLVNKWVGL